MQDADIKSCTGMFRFGGMFIKHIVVLKKKSKSGFKINITTYKPFKLFSINNNYHNPYRKILTLATILFDL